MKTFWRGSVVVGALAVALLAVAQMAAAQAPRASDKARGYFGPAASPDPVDAIWLAPPGMGQQMDLPTRPGRRFSYNSGTRFVQPVTPRTQIVQTAPPTPAPAAPNATAPSATAPSASAPMASVAPRRYSYQPAFRANWMDRVLQGNPANRDAAAKAQGNY
jgi:hypothetical protein